MDAVKGGSAGNILATAADSRRGEPGSDSEQLLGDGSAAVMVGATGVVASIEGSYSLSEEFMDSWRKQNDDYMKKGDAAFVQAYGYGRMVPNCIQGILKKYEMKISDIAQFVIPASDSRVYARVTKTLNLPAGSYPEDPLADHGRGYRGRRAVHASGGCPGEGQGRRTDSPLRLRGRKH